MKWISILFILISNYESTVTAQIDVSGIVEDAISLETLPFVNIGLLNFERGTVSNELGRFEMTKVQPSDTLIFSYVGYQSLSIAVSDISMGEHIQLAQLRYEIGGIVISAEKFSSEDVIIGVHNKNRGHSIGFGNSQLGTEVGSPLFIDRTTFIKSAHFVLNHAKGDSLLFRVNIYDFKDGVVGEKILLENVFIKEKQRKGIISVDLSTYNLIVENPVLLSLEWLKNFDEIGNKAITFDTKKAKKLRGVYLKRSSNGKFEKLKGDKDVNPCFYLVGVNAGK